MNTWKSIQNPTSSYPTLERVSTQGSQIGIYRILAHTKLRNQSEWWTPKTPIEKKKILDCQKIGLIAKCHLKLKTQAPLHTYLNDELLKLLQFEKKVKEFHNISILHITFLPIVLQILNPQGVLYWNGKVQSPVLYLQWFRLRYQNRTDEQICVPTYNPNEPYLFHTLAESRRANKLKYVSEGSISLTFWVRDAWRSGEWKFETWLEVGWQKTCDLIVVGVCLEFDHVPKWCDAWRHWGGNTWQTIYPSFMPKVPPSKLNPNFFTLASSQRYRGVGLHT